ncbi:MAG: T9SS type A sorting domain-containing protein [Mucilaginibacter sp.]|nr:T9SS type A sorting domain-containing protein [Mucilaginibacter sp.]
MSLTLRTLFISAALLFLAFKGNAQSLSRSAVSSAGTTVTTSKYSVTYIVGETVGDLFENKRGSIHLTAGFAQPDLTIQDIVTANVYRNPNFIVFPNPVDVSSSVKLAFKNAPEGRYSLFLFDALGRLLQSREVYYQPTFFAYQEFAVSEYPKGVYFIKIVCDDRLKGTVSFVR